MNICVHQICYPANESCNVHQQAEKIKHDEKETKKLQDSLQSLQLRLTTREQAYRSLQDKVGKRVVASFFQWHFFRLPGTFTFTL